MRGSSLIIGASAAAVVVVYLLRRRRSISPHAAVSCSVPYVDAAIKRALTAAGWVVTDSDDPPPRQTSALVLQWADFSAIRWDDVLAGTSTASMQYLKTGLVRKAELIFYMTKHRVEHWLPLTLTGDIEDEEDVDELLAKWKAHPDGERSLWLLKPSKANRGEGISILLHGDEVGLRAALRDDASSLLIGDWLLQVYVRPLLLPAEPIPQLSAAACPKQGLKCHLRVHVLALGALSVWIHEDPLVMLASAEWSEPNASLICADRTPSQQQQQQQQQQGEPGMLAHLTNHAQQRHGAAYCTDTHTRSFAEAFGEGFRATLLVQLKQLVRDTFKPFAKGSTAFFALPHCFEIFGLDVALDEHGHAFLLEANSGPDLSLHGERLRPQADRMLGDAVEILTRHLYRGHAAAGAAAALGVGDMRRLHGESAAASPRAGDRVGGFECVSTRHCEEPAAELERFKRALSTVGKFAHSLHAAAGAPVRGVQGRALAARTQQPRPPG